MTAKEALHQRVDGLSEAEAQSLLRYLDEADPDELTPEEWTEIRESEEEAARGETITLDELRTKYAV